VPTAGGAGAKPLLGTAKTVQCQGYVWVRLGLGYVWVQLCLGLVRFELCLGCVWVRFWMD
jgi:hypothetical protein